jgi:hypothetical protein
MARCVLQVATWISARCVLQVATWISARCVLQVATWISARCVLQVVQTRLVLMVGVTRSFPSGLWGMVGSRFNILFQHPYCRATSVCGLATKLAEEQVHVSGGHAQFF